MAPDQPKSDALLAQHLEKCAEGFINDLLARSEPARLYELIQSAREMATNEDKSGFNRMFAELIVSAYFTTRQEQGHKKPYLTFRKAYIRNIRALYKLALKRLSE